MQKGPFYLDLVCICFMSCGDNMGLFGSSSKSSNTTQQTSMAATDDSQIYSIAGSNNQIIDPGAFALARQTVEQSGENFDTVVGFASQIEANRAQETEGYRNQLADNASEAIQRTAAGIQTAFQTAEGAIDPIKIFAGAAVLIGFGIWRFTSD